MTRSLDWMDDVACAGRDLAIFFPPKIRVGRRTLPPDYRRALRHCARCPVVDRCLDYALDVVDLAHNDGVYGGLTPDQLRVVAATPPAEGRR